MENELVFAESSIKFSGYSRNNTGGVVLNAFITSKIAASTIWLNLSEIELLEQALKCSDVPSMNKKRVTIVSQNGTIKAIGANDAYFKLWSRHGATATLSEKELCELFNCTRVIKIDRDGLIVEDSLQDKPGSNFKYDGDRMVCTIYDLLKYFELNEESNEKHR